MNDTPALKFPVSVRNLPQKGLAVTIKADERERAALARDHGLEEVKSFEAELQIMPWKKRGVKVHGRIVAEIVQSCVVTLEPIDARMAETVESIFVPDDSSLARIRLDESGEMLIDAEGPDMPETFSGDHLDIGAIAEEFFELNLDPFPRKAGLPDEPLSIESGDMAPEKPVSPFVKLADWKKKS
ncbi:YceD family protein [Phyllobacterium leguminum]|uniref:Uncharacterized protein DUF177 involved in 23S rRNA accumulation n=1 Tax=Phyllobacterium leguminum TaxID=314237 RepID=A0A318TFA6_9HYPH|nr:DUF177 domain-containing protein [Phyllobacterium leguminum]PYE87167.1 uncharacterized protein DUF177 involved in 23S rRNA accumulation [Phyllobacterium leguminum]